MLVAAAAMFSACSGYVDNPDDPNNNGNTEPTDEVFELLSDQVDLRGVGGEFELTLCASMEYDISSIPEWIEEVSSRDSYVENQIRYIFLVQKNTELDGRTGEIVFSNGKKDLTFTVNQAGKAFFHRSVAMRFTGDWCPACPSMAHTLAEAKKTLQDKLEVISLHDNGGLAVNGAMQLSDKFRVNEYPTGIVDGRMKLPYGVSASVTTKYIQKFSDATAELYSTVCGIAFTTSLTGRQVTVDADITLAVADSYRITVMLVEDNVVGYQAGQGDDYVHNDVVRYFLTSPVGDAFKAASAYEVKEFSYSAMVDGAYSIDDMRVIIYVERAFGDREKVQDGQFGEYYIDNSASCRIGESVELRYEE